MTLPANTIKLAEHMLDFSHLSPPYGTITADPPWMYQKNPGSKGSGVGAQGIAEVQYPTMTTEDILAMPVGSLAAEAAHLYLWTTVPKMFGGRFSDITAKDICEGWGFEFKTMLTWVKPGSGGLGWYFRGQTEHVIFGTRGGPKAAIPPAIRQANVIQAKRGRHSEKPQEFFDLVERVSPGPYLELFARTQQPGWDAWGNEMIGGIA